MTSNKSRHKITHKNNVWDAVTHSVNTVFGEGQTTDKVKKKWFNLNI